MALPNPFQKLRHGVLMCRKNFDTFVETFNFLVDFTKNIRGDGDNNMNGSIVFDRTVPDCPVIRSKINMDWLSSIKDGDTKDKGRFRIASQQVVSTGTVSVVLDNCYYRIGGDIYTMNGSCSISLECPCILAVEVDISGSSPSAGLKRYSGMSALSIASQSVDKHILPLYAFDSECKITCDFRIGVDAAQWEF